MERGSPDHESREDCSPRRVLEIFASKWTSMILHVLYKRLDGCARTGVLLRSLPGISKKMLTQTLRDMEVSGLVTRRVYGTVPPAVDYSLTPLGCRFIEPIDLLYDWARTNADALDELVAKPGSRRDMRGTGVRVPDKLILTTTPSEGLENDSYISPQRSR